jgi:hypothetical protein
MHAIQTDMDTNKRNVCFEKSDTGYEKEADYKQMG